MEIVETTLPGVGFGALIRSHRDGDLVVLTIGAIVGYGRQVGGVKPEGQ